MNIENFNLTEILFRHKSLPNISVLGKEVTVNSVIIPDSPTVFSKHRSPRARKNVKTSGATKILDYLYVEDAAAVYYSEKENMAYAEFKVDQETYHCLAKNDGSVSFAEEDLGFRYRKLFAFLAHWIAVIGLPDSLVSLQKMYTDKVSSDEQLKENAILGFTDEFYYLGIKDFPTLDVSTGDKSLLPQIQAAFRAGIFSGQNRFGTGFHSEYERKCEKSESVDYSATWAEIKDGKYILDYEWDRAQKAYITPLSFLDNYVPDGNFFTVFGKLKKRLNMALERVKKGDMTAKKKDAVNIFLAGRPGTGKTYMLFALSAAFGFPIRSIPMGKNTEEDTFEGMNKIVDGKLTEIKTPFLQNAESGGISVIEEINLADPDVVMGAIGQFVEFPYTVMEQGYHPVTRHPLNIICGTMNIGTAGSKEVSEALSSRFPSTYILDDPKEEDFIARLEIEGFERKMCEWVYQTYTDILAALKSPDYNCEDYALNVTFRSCLGALQEMEDGSSPKAAIRSTMVGKIAEKDLEIADRIWQEIVESGPNAPAM